MIVVIADDFTGAAEIAGVGLTHGLRVKITINDLKPSDAEMLVIATDTRSMTPETAVSELNELLRKLPEIQPGLVYKKIDSALRGHILEETIAMVQILDVCGAIVVPANPLLGRIIVDGKYYIDGQLLEDTSFSEDPEFGINTSSVIEILERNSKGTDLRINKPGEFKGEGTIIVGEASTAGDLQFWAEKFYPEWLPCGAAGFFQALLKSIGKPVVNGNHNGGLPLNARTLFLCGSTFQGSRDMVSRASTTGPFVSYIPPEVLKKEAGFMALFAQWVGQVIQIIETHGKVIIAVQGPLISDAGISAWIRDCSASLVREVYNRTLIEELVVEGGSTASAVVHSMGITRFKPLHQFQHGVIRMKVENLRGLNMTLKPGSYIWPDNVWGF